MAVIKPSGDVTGATPILKKSCHQYNAQLKLMPTLIVCSQNYAYNVFTQSLSNCSKDGESPCANKSRKIMYINKTPVTEQYSTSASCAVRHTEVDLMYPPCNHKTINIPTDYRSANRPLSLHDIVIHAALFLMFQSILILFRAQ